MVRRQRFLVLLAGAHLVLVVCGATGLFPGARTWPGRALAAYGALSGADNSYGFFAPGVAPQRRARFVLTDRSGHSWTEHLTGSARSEASLRVGSIFDTAADPQWREEMTTFWVARLFARHRSAQSITALLEVEILPSMEEHREGRRPCWRVEFQATFERTSPEESRERGR
jgi:hypothetical protein